MILTQLIKQKALELGFADCGIAQAKTLPQDADHLRKWLEKEYHADMTYMSNHFDKRTDIRLLVENAQSIVVVLANYSPFHRQKADVPQVAKCAYGMDYHFVVKEKLRQLFAFINEHQPANGRCFVDSAPVFEKRWAQQAGLGWIGKNDLLIHPKFGSFCFIGELILDIPLDYDSPMENRCGTCTKCLDACPTNALVEPMQLNAKRCLSYYTIESKREIPDGILQKLNRRVFGCDACQDVCPWNENVPTAKIPALIPSKKFLSLSSEQWKKMDKELFYTVFQKSAMKRAGFEKVKSIIERTEKERK